LIIDKYYKVNINNIHLKKYQVCVQHSSSESCGLGSPCRDDEEEEEDGLRGGDNKS
jgi:hypothetical protein